MMITQEFSVAGKTSFNVVMEEETIGLEEVIAVGYGTMRRSDLTGSVATVKVDELQASQDVDNSLRAGANPGNSSQEAQNGLTAINPQDIESVEILKDASELLDETHEFFDTRRRGIGYLKTFFEHHNSMLLFNAVNDFLFPVDNASLTRLLLLSIPDNEVNTNELIGPSNQNPGY
jgi:hypothetical protein